MKLTDVRNDIDELDSDKLMPVLKQRLDLTKLVIQCKNQENLPIVNKEREQQVITSFESYMKENNLPPQCGHIFARALIDAAIIVEKSEYEKMN